MIGLLAFFLLLWLVMIFVGFTLKGLLWLAIAGIILLAVTSVVGYVRRSSIRGPRP